MPLCLKRLPVWLRLVSFSCSRRLRSSQSGRHASWGVRLIAKLRVTDVAVMIGGEALVDGVRTLSEFHVLLLFPGSQGQIRVRVRVELHMEAPAFGWILSPYNVGLCLGDTGIEPVTSTV